MNKKTINILLIINLIVIISIFICFYLSNMGAFGYRVEINDIVFVFPIINIALILINLMKSINKKLKNLLIIIFIISSFVFPIYKLESWNVPTGVNSHLMGIGLKTDYINIYGIKIFKKN